MGVILCQHIYYKRSPPNEQIRLQVLFYIVLQRSLFSNMSDFQLGENGTAFTVSIQNFPPTPSIQQSITSLPVELKRFSVFRRDESVTCFSPKQ